MAANLGLQANLALEEEAGRALVAWAPQRWPVAADWRPALEAFLSSPAGGQLGRFIEARLAAGATIYPPQPFRALELTPLAGVRMVILGQDPYHGPGQAEGLAFSVAPGVKLPPSLRNIFKELQREFGAPVPTQGSLQDWARQGVLLLNTCLTVEDGQPASHARQGWEVLTDALLAAVAARPQPCVYLLWGAQAQAKAALIEQTAAANGGEALVLRANHPSPLSALRPPVPFLGCGHFGLARDWLAARGTALRL
ncbi:MAG: uracil-DNA glycosylase [Ramlibacter sp.]|nr:uracil-DNA glycosylase [Ramlibacter sp.]